MTRPVVEMCRTEIFCHEIFLHQTNYSHLSWRVTRGRVLGHGLVAGPHLAQRVAPGLLVTRLQVFGVGVRGKQILKLKKKYFSYVIQFYFLSCIAGGSFTVLISILSPTFCLQESTQHQQTQPESATQPRTSSTMTATTPSTTASTASRASVSRAGKWTDRWCTSRQNASSRSAWGSHKTMIIYLSII